VLIIKIHNDSTGSNKLANYNYGVYINARRIANGVIKGHNRSDGWQKLVHRLIEYDSIKNKERNG